MSTTVNPGSFLRLVGSLEIVPPSGPIRVPIVIDRESGRVVTLVELLSAFREDPADNVLGPVSITIQPAARWWVPLDPPDDRREEGGY